MRQTSEESRLANPFWRLWHSKWLLAVVLGFGMLSFVGFVYVGLRVRTRRFWVALVVGCLGSAVTWAVPTETDADGATSVTDLGAGITLAVWVAFIVYAALLNRHYLRWRAGRTKEDTWYNQPPPSAPAAVGVPMDAPTSSDAAGQILAAVGAVERRIDGTVHPTVAAQVRRVTMTVVEMIPRLSELGPHEVRTVVTTATSYLPEAVDTYLRLPHHFAETHEVAPGKTAMTLLVDQLDLLATTLEQILHALLHRDADALITYGTFLAEKFGADSALDLPGPDQAFGDPPGPREVP